MNKNLKLFGKSLADKYLFPSQNRFASYAYQAGMQVFNNKFISFRESMDLTFEWAKSLPSNIDIVIGIPRHGMLTGSIAALYLGKPLASLDQFLKGDYWEARASEQKKPTASFKRALLVDDSIGTGKQISSAKARLSKQHPKLKILTGVVHIPKSMKDKIDYYKEIDTDRLFELDLVNEFEHESFGVDMDGVLCQELGVYEGLYPEERFKEAPPLRIPTMKIKFIATNRNEAYRKITEDWLKKYKVNYGELIMHPGDDDDYLKVKVAAIRKYKPMIFWESSTLQAKQIFLLTGCRVLCFENMYLYGGKVR